MKSNYNYLNWHLKHAKAWQNMPSPARPSLGELAIFGKYLLNLHDKKPTKLHVLILGSTPEFRDMCNKSFCDVTCIDINEPIYKALTLLQKSPNNRERLIHANWLTFNIPEKFDIIFGDAVTAMFPLKYYRKFFRNMSHHLVSDGRLILRVPYQNNDCNIQPDQVLQCFRNLDKKAGINIYTATYNFFAMYYLDKLQSNISLTYLYERIKELRRDNIISENEFQKLRPYYENLTLELSYPTEEYLNSTFRKYFSILAKEFSLDYLTSFSNPVYIFAKAVTVPIFSD